ncbi:hypothetical protein, partial [Shewanella sp.]|uniref:hypothetical protein n=1 Tax=Shewanella sp. TaxID=50422 RepID=UPI003A98162B
MALQKEEFAECCSTLFGYSFLYSAKLTHRYFTEFERSHFNMRFSMLCVELAVLALYNSTSLFRAAYAALRLMTNPGFLAGVCFIRLVMGNALLG